MASRSLSLLLDLHPFVDQKENNVPRPHSHKGRHEAFEEGWDALRSDGGHGALHRGPVKGGIALDWVGLQLALVHQPRPYHVHRVGGQAGQEAGEERADHVIGRAVGQDVSPDEKVLSKVVGWQLHAGDDAGPDGRGRDAAPEAPEALLDVDVFKAANDGGVGDKICPLLGLHSDLQKSY